MILKLERVLLRESPWPLSSGLEIPWLAPLLELDGHISIVSPFTHETLKFRDTPAKALGHGLQCDLRCHIGFKLFIESRGKKSNRHFDVVFQGLVI